MISSYPLSWPAGWRQAGDAIYMQLQAWAPPVLFDVSDAGVVMNLGWYAHRSRSGIYVRTDVYAYGKRKSYQMHRLLVGAKLGEIWDHRNGNTLDNRRSNLRLATSSQNAANGKPRGKYSEFKGVTRDKRTGKWVAQIGKDYEHIHIGTYTDELVAAAAYDISARHHHGEFARLNLGVLILEESATGQWIEFDPMAARDAALERASA